ncbi:MAG: radical SAM protein, partial [Spirochaetota bacterium]
MSIILKNQTAAQLYADLSSLGVTERIARRIQGALFRTGTLPSSLPEISDKVLARVKGNCTVPRLVCEDKAVSPRDGFAKYLFSGAGAGSFEAVRIPVMNNENDRKYIVCVSSQAGCAVGCAFCRTGRLGFIRDLAPWEIVDQVLQIRDDSDYPVRGVVFMGMGEPMLNLDAVLTAAQIITEPCALAISGKAVTISTSGIVPGILALAAAKVPYRLVVSLSSADPAVRKVLI